MTDLEPFAGFGEEADRRAAEAGVPGPTWRIWEHIADRDLLAAAMDAVPDNVSWAFDRIAEVRERIANAEDRGDYLAVAQMEEIIESLRDLADQTPEG